MTKAAREARRAYKRKWQRENPDKVKEYQRRYWEKQAELAKAVNVSGNEKAQQ